jgi:hypothetical protein
MRLLSNRILSRVGGMTYKTSFGLDDWIYGHLIYKIRNYKQLQLHLLPTDFTVHRYTHIRVLSLH